ncbi:MAG: RNA 3'-terminal phosphate cyclase [Candidatus Bathyarchaeota archaeon]|nr:RNA 3'-terminal phosphate cyclase [Candidatus Bathyarchaeota archaeon]
MINVDGSMMEGGGQLLRMATTYSAILSEPIKVNNIRANRSPPGLKPQHLTTLLTASKMCRGELKGAKPGSTEIEFHPGVIKGGDYHVDIGTAGSVSLLLQCLAPIATYADSPVKLSVRGGTAVAWSPTICFVKNVVWGAFRSMGMSLKLGVIKHGFYPKGGGEVEALIKPVRELRGFTIDHGSVETIHGSSLCGRLPSHVAERQAASAQRVLSETGIESMIEVASLEGIDTPRSPGSMICLWAENMPMGADSLGKRGKPAEKVGAEAAISLLRQLKTGASVDYHTSDHLILPCSLARGQSSFKTSRLTLHTLTAIELAKMFTGAEFKVSGREGKPATILCNGVGK